LRVSQNWSSIVVIVSDVCREQLVDVFYFQHLLSYKILICTIGHN
jgi:hypothetical protein